LETAINSNADWLVTFNVRHLWRLRATSGFVSCGRPMHGNRYKSRRGNVLLGLQASLLDEARRVSEAEGVSLNQSISVAVAEKLYSEIGTCPSFAFNV